jgi:hypothetical protein
MASIKIRVKKTDEQITVVDQTVIPRIGETIWLHSGEEMNTHKIKDTFGTTSFRVVEVCHWLSPKVKDYNSVLVYVKKVKI